MPAERVDADVIALAEVLGGLVADDWMQELADAPRGRAIADISQSPAAVAGDVRQGRAP